MICFTCDLDWAHDVVLADTLELFRHWGVPCTFFATHATPVLANLDERVFEVGIHPNFNPLLTGASGSPETVLDNLLGLYPGTKGLRSHSLTTSTPLQELFASRGLAYEANLLLPYAKGLSPFTLWNGLLRLPYNWEDDVHCLYGKNFFSTGLDLEAELNVLSFHPIHVYLNTEHLDRYEQARPFFHDPSSLMALRNKSKVPGVRDLLVDLLTMVASERRAVLPLIKLAETLPSTNHPGVGP